MIKITDISFSFDENVIFDNFSHTFEDNSITFLCGESGAGKTTLFNLIAGLLKPDSGTIETNGRICYMFQEPRLVPQINAIKNIELVTGKDFSREEIIKLLDKAGLSDSINKLPSELSGGMQKRLSLVRALAYARKCANVLLDEPFSGLDENTHNKMISLIKEELKGKTVVIISHDISDTEKSGAFSLTKGKSSAT